MNIRVPGGGTTVWEEVLILTITTLCVFFAMTRLAKTSRDHALEANQVQ